MHVPQVKEQYRWLVHQDATLTLTKEIHAAFDAVFDFRPCCATRDRLTADLAELRDSMMRRPVDPAPYLRQLHTVVEVLEAKRTMENPEAVEKLIQGMLSEGRIGLLSLSYGSACTRSRLGLRPRQGPCSQALWRAHERGAQLSRSFPRHPSGSRSR